MRSIIYILLILGIYFGICIFIGMNWALITLAAFMIILATSFIVKRDFYIKYTEFVNPKYASLYSLKDDEFKRKHRVIDIVGFYIISAFMLLLSAIIGNLKLPLQGSSLAYLIIPVVLLSILLWGLSLVILKKSKKNSSFWFYFIAMIFFAILVLGIIEYILL